VASRDAVGGNDAVDVRVRLPVPVTERVPVVVGESVPENVGVRLRVRVAERVRVRVTEADDDPDSDTLPVALRDPLAESDAERVDDLDGVSSHVGVALHVALCVDDADTGGVALAAHVSDTDDVSVCVTSSERVLEHRWYFRAGTPLSMNIEIPVATWLMYVMYCAFGSLSTPFSTHVTCVPDTLNEAQIDAVDPRPSDIDDGYGSVQSTVNDDPSVQPRRTMLDVAWHVPVVSTIAPRGSRLDAVTVNCSELFCPSTMIQYVPICAVLTSTTHVVPFALTMIARHCGTPDDELPRKEIVHGDAPSELRSVIASPLLHPSTCDDCCSDACVKFRSMFTSHTIEFSPKRHDPVRVP
jgi:hypothetical protein